MRFENRAPACLSVGLLWIANFWFCPPMMKRARDLYGALLFIYLFIFFQKKVFYVDLFFFFVFIEFTASFLFYVLVSFGQEACGMPYLSN